MFTSERNHSIRVSNTIHSDTTFFLFRLSRAQEKTKNKKTNIECYTILSNPESPFKLTSDGGQQFQGRWDNGALMIVVN